MKNFAANIFKYRSYTPIPFLILMLIFQNATPLSLVIGFAMALFGEFWRLWGVSYAGSETRTTGGVGGTFLVVSGAYAHLRNPLYLGNILMYIGIGVASMALFPYLQIVALAFFFWQYSVIIKEEENFLRGKFGNKFDDYCSSVQKIIPGFSKYENPGIEQPQFNLSDGLRSETRTLQAFGIIILLVIIRYTLS